MNPKQELETFVRKFAKRHLAAEKLGISESYLSRLLAGKFPMTDSICAKLGLRRVETVTVKFERAKRPESRK